MSRTKTPGLTDKLLAIALWGIGLLWMLPMMGTMMLMYTVVTSYQTNWFTRIYTRGQVLLTGSRWRAIVDPAVDPNQVYMFAQNHVNLFDHVTMYNATPHFKQGLELEAHFKIPVYGWFMKARGTIPVQKGSGGQSQKILDNIRRDLDAKRSILVFPEGHRTLDGHVGPYRKGVFFIARDLGLPVIPVAVTGMYDVKRKGSWLIRPGQQITVHICAPIPTRGLSDEEVADLALRVQQITAGHVDAQLAEADA